MQRTHPLPRGGTDLIDQRTTIQTGNCIQYRDVESDMLDRSMILFIKSAKSADTLLVCSLASDFYPLYLENHLP